MDLRESIKKIDRYFKLFTISEGVAYILMDYPDKWVLPKIKNNKIQVQKEPNMGVYYLTEIKNDPDILFKMAETTIDLNRKIEEKRQLLAEKTEELKKLFASENLDKLKNLTYNFGDSHQADENIPLGEEIAQKEIEEVSNDTEETTVEVTEPIKVETNVKEEDVKESGATEIISDEAADTIMKLAKKVNKGR